jgi:hypothetical protein
VSFIVAFAYFLSLFSSPLYSTTNHGRVSGLPLGDVNLKLTHPAIATWIEEVSPSIYAATMVCILILRTR